MKKCITVLNKKVRIRKRGKGDYPLLIVGPASIFQQPGFLPKEFDTLFKIYFVDWFIKNDKHTPDYSQLTLAHFVDVVEDIRVQLDLKKVILFSHSAMGILAIEYAKKHTENVLFNIVIATSPIWGHKKEQSSKLFFRYNATKQRQRMYINDHNALKKQLETFVKQTSLQKTFIAKYSSRRTQFFRHPERYKPERLWPNIEMDMPLIMHYFSLISAYDVQSGEFEVVPTFLALGLYDYSCPFYHWTDDNRAMLEKMHYYIFKDSGHYPMMTESGKFIEELIHCMESKGLYENISKASHYRR